MTGVIQRNADVVITKRKQRKTPALQWDLKSVNLSAYVFMCFSSSQQIQMLFVFLEIYISK